MPSSGFIVAEVASKADLQAWTALITSNTVVSGAAEFFTAMLEHRNLKPVAAEHDSLSFDNPVLVVRGTAFYGAENQAGIFLKSFKQYETPGSIGDEGWLQSAACFDLANSISRDLALYGKVGLSIPSKNTVTYSDPLLLRKHIAELCAIILSSSEISELIIEGGSTAAAILKALQINTVYPLRSLGPGVLSMAAKEWPGLKITLKPGSYAWPAAFILAMT